MELINDARPDTRPFLPSEARGTKPDAPGAQKAALPRLENRFAELSPPFYSDVVATPLPDPYLIAVSEDTSRLLGLEPAALASQQWTEALCGNTRLPGSRPLAAVYSGHQFGVWAGQLGDGRALLLGDLATAGGRFELQLKGAGRTPYSRMGDGRAVLRSSIREYLCSEAMAALGIPTTRALALVGSDFAVLRESVETAAVVTRVAESFVRFGSFEHWYAAKDVDRLRILADYVISTSYAHLAQRADRYAALLAEITQRSATLVARWQAVGFCHGVLNTDNMSVIGLTLDYGPFGFLERFDLGFVCNHSDSEGRYAFAAQPGVVHWNLYCLAQALLPLIDSVDDAKAALAGFESAYEDAILLAMRAKLGLQNANETDAALIDSLYGLLEANHPDHTTFFRQLSKISRSDRENDAAITDHMIDREATSAWLDTYRERLKEESRSDELRRLAMDAVNPKYILRNYLAETAIRHAQARDYTEIARLAAVLSRPFDEQPESASYAEPAPEWALGLEVSCSS
jgi:uncharacterized protein YdiU (UPF0061 family)